MKKLFTSLTLLLCVCGAWASTEVINAGQWANNALYSGTCVYTSSISGAGDGQFSAGDGGGNIKNYSPSNKGIKLRTQRASVTVSETEYGFVLFSVRSGYKVNSVTIEGTSNGSDNTVTLKGVYADVNTASLATSIAGATSVLATDKVYPNSGTNYITSGTLSVNAENNILLLFDKSGGNQLRAIITFDYELSGVAAPTITQYGKSITLTSATDGASIYYTLNASTPTSSSTAYNGTPFTLDNPCTVRAIAVKDDEASGVTDKDCYFTPTGAMALLKFTSGELDGEDAYLWTSTDGDYTLRDNNTAQTNKYTSLEAGNDAFKLSHVDGYTLTPSADIKITKIAFIGKSLYEGYTGTVKVTGFNSDVASSFIAYPAEGQKYLSTIEFTSDATLNYGTAVNFNPGGCESAAYIVIYGEKRVGPADPVGGAGDPITWDFTKETAKSLTSNASYSFLATNGTTELRYSAGSSDAIETKSNNTYLKENGTTGSSTSVKDIDGSTTVGKSRLIRLYVAGKGKLRINCLSSNVGAYKVYDSNVSNTAALSSTALLSSYTANTTSDEITVTNGLWIETTTKGYITSIVWTPSATGTILTTTANMAGWRAFYDADNSYTVDENTTVYIATAKDESSVTLTSIADIPSATPVILKTSANDFTMTLTKADATSSTTGNLLQASTSGQNLSGGNIYRLGYGDDGIGFYPWSTTSATAGIVYINTGDGARSLRMVFADESTGIGAMLNDAIINSNVYDLQGRRVAQPQRGLYIMNGRKVVVK